MATRTNLQAIEPLTIELQGVLTSCAGSGRRTKVERTQFGTVYSCIKCNATFTLSQIGNTTWPTAPEHGKGGS